MFFPEFWGRTLLNANEYNVQCLTPDRCCKNTEILRPQDWVFHES